MTTPAEKTWEELKILRVDSVLDYLCALNHISKNVCIAGRAPKTGNDLKLDYAIDAIGEMLQRTCLFKKKIIVIGNGGSAAIALHALADYANAGGLQTMDLMNPALITCMANDYGYEMVFAETIGRFAEKYDVLFAISSSGQSSNILNACKAAENRECNIVTFSGFNPENPLRKMGDINFYVSSSHYGFVELTHQILLHCILDFYLKRRIENKW